MRKKAETIPPVDSPSHSGIDAWWAFTAQSISYIHHRKPKVPELHTSSHFMGHWWRSRWWFRAETLTILSIKCKSTWEITSSRSDCFLSCSIALPTNWKITNIVSLRLITSPNSLDTEKRNTCASSHGIPLRIQFMFDMSVATWLLRGTVNRSLIRVGSRENCHPESAIECPSACLYLTCLQ
jgi:hypothetical protein